MTDVLVVEDDATLREALCDTLEMSGHSVSACCDGEAALSFMAGNVVSLVVSDIQMRPMDGLTLLHEIKSKHVDIPILLMTAYATVAQAVEAMRDGATDYLVKPFDAEVLVSKISQHLPVAGSGDEGMVAEDPSSRELLELAQRVSESDATVMISGESGSGKEVLARFIHNNSSRDAQPFVAINCAAIPDNMLEAVLFGYEKGAYTGAYKSSPGKFEQAQGGTLLLDEISEMPMGLQAKLLRVLQEREVERLGGHRMIPLDIRVLATSNRDMAHEVREGRFREDLFYRLNVFPLRLAPLRERRGDILPLAGQILAHAAREKSQPPLTLSTEARVRLQEHNWPGNVRELENVIQRAVILRGKGEIAAVDLFFEQVSLEQVGGSEPAPKEDEGGLGSDLKVRERALIAAALEEGNGSRQYAAKKLGISPRTLRYKLQQMREAGIAL